MGSRKQNGASANQDERLAELMLVPFLEAARQASARMLDCFDCIFCSRARGNRPDLTAQDELDDELTRFLKQPAVEMFYECWVDPPIPVFDGKTIVFVRPSVSAEDTCSRAKLVAQDFELKVEFEIIKIIQEKISQAHPRAPRSLVEFYKTALKEHQEIYDEMVKCRVDHLSSAEEIH